jgi:hypothetical protein
MTPDRPALLNPETLPKLPRRKLGRGTLALLILLRVYVALAVPMVAYAFIKAVWG